MYTTVKAGLISRLQTIDGLNDVLGYEPTAPDPPTMCVILDSFTRQVSGQITVMKYRVIARIYIRWQDFEGAELELDQYVNAVGMAIDEDPQLEGALTRGIADVTDAKAGWVTVGEVNYRILDTFIEIVEKGGFGSTL